MRVYDMEKAAALRAEASEGDEPGEVTTFVGHSSSVYGIDFSPDSQLLLSASGDGSVRLWHLPLSACLNSYR